MTDSQLLAKMMIATTTTMIITESDNDVNDYAAAVADDGDHDEQL